MPETFETLEHSEVCKDLTFSSVEPGQNENYYFWPNHTFSCGFGTRHVHIHQMQTLESRSIDYYILLESINTWRFKEFQEN